MGLKNDGISRIKVKLAILNNRNDNKVEMDEK